MSKLLCPLLFMLGCSIAGCRAAPVAEAALPTTVRGLRTPAAYQPLPPTANGTSPIAFVNVATQAGLNYRWTLPAKRPLTIRHSMGNGCAFLDFNNDGNLDILLVGNKVALYRGDGQGHFHDVTNETGLSSLHGEFAGCAVGDYDNDGFADIYLSGYQCAALLHNQQGKRFKEVAKAMGLAPQPFGTSCAFVDADGDGYPDLFVGNYVKFTSETKPQLCRVGTVMSSCFPGHYPALQGTLYHNQGGQHFANVTAAAKAETSGADLGVACADFDGSGKMGIAVANDEKASDLFQQTGAPGRIQLLNTGVTSGIASDRFGHNHGGMGIDWGDYDNDGRPDLFVATFSHEDKCLYHNLGDGVFEERSVETGLHRHSNRMLRLAANSRILIMTAGLT